MKLNNKIVFYLVTILSLIVYVLTLNPDVTYTDSGELAGACVKLGVAHPTGYPLFILIGHLWTLLPLHFSKIYSLNLMTGTWYIPIQAVQDKILEHIKENKN